MLQGLQVACIMPTHQRETLRRVQQSVDRRVAQGPSARCIERQPGRSTVEAIHHAAMGDDHHRLALVRIGDAPKKAKYPQIQIRR